MAGNETLGRNCDILQKSCHLAGCDILARPFMVLADDDLDEIEWPAGGACNGR